MGSNTLPELMIMINVVVTLPETEGLLFLYSFLLKIYLLLFFYEAFPSFQEGPGVVRPGIAKLHIKKGIPRNAFFF